MVEVVVPEETVTKISSRVLIALLVGIPASGKSTLANLLSENSTGSDTVKLVNLDELQTKL